jgi:hypothetical protein
VTPKTPNGGQKARKYNNPKDLDELCKGFLEGNDADKGAAMEYCKNFLSVLTEKQPVTGAVLSSRAKSR